MLRAVIVAIKGGGATQGGSTITQQYVKNYFLSSDRTLTRKYKEILLSIKIDQQQSKQQILELYLDWHRIERASLADGGRARTEVLWISPAAAARGRQLRLMEVLA
jgi:hypothetical protein